MHVHALWLNLQSHMLETESCFDPHTQASFGIFLSPMSLLCPLSYQHGPSNSVPTISSYSALAILSLAGKFHLQVSLQNVHQISPTTVWQENLCSWHFVITRDFYKVVGHVLN